MHQYNTIRLWELGIISESAALFYKMYRKANYPAMRDLNLLQIYMKDIVVFTISLKNPY